MDLTRIKQIWAGLDTRNQLTLVGGIVGVLVTFYLLYGYATKQTYTTLATGLQPAQTGQAEQALASAGVSYRVGTGGTELDVPSSQMSQARIALASKGVLNSSQNAFQAFNSSSLGTTDFQQQVQYQQALQQQIAGTIEQIQGVNSATVELVIPQDSLFADSQTKATAAVLVNGGSSLSSSTIAGMAHLVSSSVKGLDPNDVSITDETGALLWPNASASGASSADSKLRADSLYASQISAEVNALLDSTLGPNKALARVQADLNVDQTTLDKVTYAKKGVPLTQQTQTESLKSQGAGGVVPAGTTTNTSTNTIGSYASSGGSGNSNYKNTTSSTTFGIDKTIEHSVVAPGKVNKLDVALLVDSSVPAAQVASLQKSVASLVGLTPSRGDTMAVTRMAFAKTSTPKAGGSPLAALGNPISLAKDVLFGLAAIIFLFLMRRALSRREKEASVPEPTWLRELESGFSITELEAGKTVALPAAPVMPAPDPVHEQIEEIAKNSPEVIASQVSQWMKE